MSSVIRPPKRKRTRWFIPAAVQQAKIETERQRPAKPVTTTGDRNR